MSSLALKCIVATALVLSGIGQAQAQDGGRIVRDILGIGVGIMLNEMERDRRQRQQQGQQRLQRHQPQQRQQRTTQRNDSRSGSLTANQLYAAQVRLNELGYDTGIPDGLSGPRTREAIRHYQRDRGMAETGTLTSQQLAGLLAAPVAPPSGNPDDVPLDGRETAELQRALLALGFDIGPADGVAGRRTAAAISRFLGDSGMDPYQVRIREAQRMILAEAAMEAPQKNSVEQSAALPRTAYAPMLPARDGAVLFATQTNHALRKRIGGGDADSYDKNLDLFGRLLILSGAPWFLDDPEKTHFFLPLVKLEELGPYVNTNALELTARHGIGHLNRWRGDNQFAREDSRTAFLAEYRDKLIAQAPNIPLRIDIVRSLRFGEYDGSSLALNVDSDSAFPHYSHVGLSAVEPFARLNRLVVDRDEARRLVELQSQILANDPYDGPVIVTRAEITAIRPTDTGVILDIAAIDITAYETAALDRPLGQLPLPPGAIVRNSGPFAASSDAAVPFDPVFVRMLAAKEQPEFAAQDAFHRETFRMRRAAERRYRNSGDHVVVDWPKLIPASLLVTNESPGASDVSTLVSWFDGVRSQLGSDAQIHGFCWFARRDIDQCDLPVDARQNDGTIALAGLVKAAINSWDYAWHGLPDGADDAVKQAYPNSAGFVSFGAGADIPGTIVLQSHPAWFSVPFPANQLNNATLDVNVVSQKIVSTPSGKGVIAVEIAPVSLRYLSDGRWQKLDIAPVEEKVAASEGMLDVLGVKIGMPLDIAREIISKHFDGRGTGALEQKKGSGPDPIFGEVFTFKMPSQYQMHNISFGSASEGEEAVRLFFDKSKVDKPILAVDRSVKFAKGLNSDAAARVSGKPALDSLMQKYGEPDRLGDIGSQYDSSLWAVKPTAKARIKSGDKFCDLNIWLSTTYYDGSPSHSSQVENDCGELLSVWFRSGVVSQVLMDTSSVLKLRQKYAAEAAAKEAAEKAAQPAVKF